MSSPAASRYPPFSRRPDHRAEPWWHFAGPASWVARLGSLREEDREGVQKPVEEEVQKLAEKGAQKPVEGLGQAFRENTV